MARRPSRRPVKRRRPAQPGVAGGVDATAISLRRATRSAWQIVVPRCARERAEDMEEVTAMIDAGESEIAIDELRWLLQECPDFLDAHRALGELALEAHDLPLARGHFGHAFDAVRNVWQQAAVEGTLPYALPENQVVHEVGKGLAWALREMGNKDLARQVVQQLLAWDPSDPLGVRAWES